MACLQIYCYKVPYIRINHDINIIFRYELGLKPPILLMGCSWPTNYGFDKAMIDMGH